MSKSEPTKFIGKSINYLYSLRNPKKEIALSSYKAVARGLASIQPINLMSINGINWSIKLILHTKREFHSISLSTIKKKIYSFFLTVIIILTRIQKITFVLLLPICHISKCKNLYYVTLDVSLDATACDRTFSEAFISYLKKYLRK